MLSIPSLFFFLFFFLRGREMSREHIQFRNSRRDVIRRLWGGGDEDEEGRGWNCTNRTTNNLFVSAAGCMCACLSVCLEASCIHVCRLGQALGCLLPYCGVHQLEPWCFHWQNIVCEWVNSYLVEVYWRCVGLSLFRAQNRVWCIHHTCFHFRPLGPGPDIHVDAAWQHTLVTVLPTPNGTVCPAGPQKLLRKGPRNVTRTPGP